MGVTLHYKGKLSSPQMIEEITNELVDISEARNWQYEIIKTSIADEVQDESGLILNGIMTGPSNCDPISMTFDESGRLISPTISVFPKEDIEKFLANDDYYAFTKTQFAGVEAHIEIVKLLKYLADKYFEIWECTDDSKYYETGDEENLSSTMGMINKAMTALDDAFSAHKDELNEANPQEMADFISNVLGIEDIEIKVINATIDEDGIEILDEDAALKDLLSDDNSDDDSNDEDDEANIDLNELLDL